LPIQEGLRDCGSLDISIDMHDPFFFGYGSLVNRATHDFPAARRARVTGWARVWRGTSLRQVAYLSAVEAPGSVIEGLAAAVPGGDWQALDLRERAYARHMVDDIDHDGPEALAVQIYKVEPHHVTDGIDHPILLSYLDTVVQGYLCEFGETGAVRFFDTTGGWHLPILDDRAAPVYPRAQVLSAEDRDFVDDRLATMGSRIVTP